KCCGRLRDREEQREPAVRCGQLPSVAGTVRTAPRRSESGGADDLVVIDGSKALRAGVERVFGEQVEVQRCQIHKRRNVKEYLPENCQKDYDRRMRNAYAMNNYAEAKEALQKIFRQLERINPSAARSLEEGLEETLTVHRLGIGAVLRRKLATTNPIESCLSTVQRVARNVKRW